MYTYLANLKVPAVIFLSVTAGVFLLVELIVPLAAVLMPLLGSPLGGLAVLAVAALFVYVKLTSKRKEESNGKRP